MKAACSRVIVLIKIRNVNPMVKTTGINILRNFILSKYSSFCTGFGLKVQKI